MNWAQRSTASGVMLATKLDSDAEILPNRTANADSVAQAQELIKRVHLAEDPEAGPCMQIDIVGDDTVNRGYTQSQGWNRRFRDAAAWPNDGDGVGSAAFWIQYGLKIPPSRLVPAAGAGGSWKHAIVANMKVDNHFGGGSSNNLSHVLTTKYRPIPSNTEGRKYFWPVQYWHNNTHTNGVANEQWFPPPISGDINLSPGWDQGPRPDYHDRYCSYQDSRGCPLWPVDAWVWFQYRIRIQSYGGTAGNEMDLWWALPGDTEWTLLQTARDYAAGQEAPWPNGFNAIWLTAYETDRQVAGGPNSWMRYRELIVSLQQIALPTEESNGGGTVPEPDKLVELILPEGTPYKVTFRGSTVPPPAPQTIDSFTATPPSISPSDNSTIAWQTSNATEVLLGGTVVSADGSQPVAPATTTEYMLTARGPAPDVVRKVTVTVATVPLPSGGWAEVFPKNITTFYQAGATKSMIPYMGFQPRLAIVGQDHPGPTPIYFRSVVYDEVANEFTNLPDQPFGGTHGYQHNALDAGGTRYLLKYGNDYGIWRKDGDVYKPWKKPPYNMSQGVAGALVWWPTLGGSKGSLVFYSGEYGAIYLLDIVAAEASPDPTVGWRALNGMLPGQVGHYHNVSAMLPNCMLYGGGNPSSSQYDTVQKKLWRLNADLSKTQLPDAPFRFGICNGMSLASLGAYAYLLGFSEFWRVDAEGAWTKLPPPPSWLPAPNTCRPMFVTRGSASLYYLTQIGSTSFRMARFTPGALK